MKETDKGEQLFRLAVESAPNAMIMVDRQGRIVLVNAQTEKLFGYPRTELMGQSIEMLVPPRFRGVHPGHRESFFKNPQARSMGAGRDLFGLRKDGTEVPVEIGLNPLTTPEGAFVLAAVVDITERKRAEEKFRLAVESAPNAMLMVDSRGRIVLANAQAEKLFGYAKQELLDHSMEMLVPGRFRERHPGHRAEFHAAPRPRPMGADRELYAVKKDGTEVPVEIGLNPIKTIEGDFVLAAIVDLSAFKAMQAEMVRTQRLAAEAPGGAREGAPLLFLLALPAPARRNAKKRRGNVGETLRNGGWSVKSEGWSHLDWWQGEGKGVFPLFCWAWQKLTWV